MASPRKEFVTQPMDARLRQLLPRRRVHAILSFWALQDNNSVYAFGIFQDDHHSPEVQHEAVNQSFDSRVSQAVWPWRTPGGASKGRRMPRPWRAALQAAVIAGVASLFYFYGRRAGLGLFLYGLSAVVLIGGLFIPPVFNAFETAGRWLGQAVGAGLTWLLLAPFYYLCVFPGRLVLLLLGKDPLCRRWDRRRDSYWVDRKPAPTRFYTRQY